MESWKAEVSSGGKYSSAGAKDEITRLERVDSMFSRICLYFSGVALFYILLFYHVIIPAGLYGHKYLRENYFSPEETLQQAQTSGSEITLGQPPASSSS